MSDVLLRRALRTVAILIAVFAFLDPAVTTNRSAKAVVSVVAQPGADSALVARVARDLSNDFTVLGSPFAGAGATVLVGDHVSTLDPGTAPVFAVATAYDRPRVVVERLEVPSEAPLAGAIPVMATVHVIGAQGRALILTLRGGDSDGSSDIPVDRAERRVASDDERVTVRLAAVPTAVGAFPLRVEAVVTGSTSVADAVVSVRDRRWRVLFYDARASWSSTFVRRAIERDPRFDVSSRIATSRALSSDAGAPPARLDDPAAIGRYDIIVVGGPDALAERDVAGLDVFLRRRAGSVALLFDARPAGPAMRLVGAATWATPDTRDTLRIVSAIGDSIWLKGTEFAWPATLPAGGVALASSALHPVVWRAAVGAGGLVVSTAFDSWRYREADQSRFDGFWRALVADAAARAVPPVSISVEPAVARPGELLAVRATVRDASDPRALASLTSAARMVPAEPAGSFAGAVRAPGSPGSSELTVSAAGSTISAPIVVRRDASLARTDRRDLLGAWATAHRGTLVESNALAGLPAALRAAISAEPQKVTWYPMRSPWWIVAFALALSAEWWLRRRRGLA